MTPLDFIDMVGSQDGVDAFNETSRLAVAAGIPGRVEILIHDGPHIVAMAFATGDAPVDLAVHPAHRRHGHAAALLDRLVARGELRFWAHGDLAAARDLAASHGLRPARTLLRLSRPAIDVAVDAPATPGTVVRPFRDEDLPGLLAVNERAFASHPEQGAMDHAEFERRARSSWFDPAGILVAERDGAIVGFHWTKLEQPGDGRRVGEVYVLAVDPAHHGHRVGSTLLAHGIHHLTQAGAGAVELYVEADNSAALALYRAHGFTEAGRDVLYVSTMPAGAGRGPS